MGIIRAALVGAGSTMADQWMEFYSYDSIPANVLVLRAKKQVGKHSSNKKGSDKIISDGSKIVVNEGQAMIMVDQGMVIEIATTPGIYTYNSADSLKVLIVDFLHSKYFFKLAGRGTEKYIQGNVGTYQVRRRRCKGSENLLFQYKRAS